MPHQTIPQLATSATLLITLSLSGALLLPEVLSYHEQYQLFQLTPQYLLQHLTYATGPAEYLAELLTQFAYYPALGATLLALPLLALQLLTWHIARQLHAQPVAHGLSLIPSLLTLALMADENIKPTLLTSLTLTLATSALYTHLHTTKNRTLFQLIAIPLLYLLAGPITLTHILLSLTIDLRQHHKPLYLAIPYYALILLISATTLMAQYATPDILLGHAYHNLRDTHPTPILLLNLTIATLPPLLSLIPNTTHHLTPHLITLLTLLIGLPLALANYHNPKYNPITYDALLRAEHYDKIITLAQQNPPTDDPSIVALNLSLAQRGQLLNTMFHYHQNGPQSLITPSLRNQFSAITSAETLLRLGLINMSLRYFFDTQEAIIDCHKSARLTKRIAELLIINHQYQMARHYLTHLSNTLFYSNWAKQTLQTINSEQTINNHPTWGRLRQYRYKTSFYSNYYELDKMLALLYDNNHQNHLALDYYLAQCLLRRDLKALWAGLAWARDLYPQLPRHIQEAIAITWAQTHPDFQNIPLPISPEVINDLAQFTHYYAHNPADPHLNTPPLRNTYWHYLLLQQPIDAQTGATNTTPNK